MLHMPAAWGEPQGGDHFLAGLAGELGPRKARSLEDSRGGHSLPLSATFAPCPQIGLPSFLVGALRQEYHAWEQVEGLLWGAL